MKSKNANRTLIFDAEGLELFAQHLKGIRKKIGISQTQLAFESGLSLSQIARIETARINPTLSTIFAITRALDIPLCELFNFELPSNNSIDQKE